MFGKQFYPTPDHLADEMVRPYFYGPLKRRDILEPSAGSGALIEASVRCLEAWCQEQNNIEEKRFNDSTPDKRKSNYFYYYNEEKECKALRNQFETCEIDPDLSSMLSGKGINVVASDFLFFSTPKRYDLIIMNPPFKDGVKHVLRAWHMLKPDGELCALLNAQTYQASDTSNYKRLHALVREYGSVEIKKKAFVDADRKTDVDVVLIKLKKKDDSKFGLFDDPKLEAIKEVKFEENALAQSSEVATRDVIGTLLRQYEAACNQYIEYRRSCRIMSTVVNVFDFEGKKTEFIKVPFDYSVSSDRKIKDVEEYNSFIAELTKAAWRTVFRLTGLEKRMTEKVRLEFEKSKSNALGLAFTRENIQNILMLIIENGDRILKQCVLDVFDEMTAYYPENRMAYEGWKTNDAYKVKQKVILPHAVECSFGYFRLSYRAENGIIADIDKAMCFLLGERIDDVVTIRDAMREMADKVKAHKGLVDTECESEFFHMRFFKKGSLHLKFKDEKLWERFNRFVAAERNWLPGQ